MNEQVLTRQQILSVAMQELKAAVEAIVAHRTSPSETFPVAPLLSDLVYAHEKALDFGVYDVVDEIDPRIDATAEVVVGLRPLISKLAEREAVEPALLDGQKEVSARNLEWMASTIVSDRTLPIDKISRWLGFIQGVLAVRGLLSVMAERDRTRTIFHRAYDLMKLVRPKSRSIDENPVRNENISEMDLAGMVDIARDRLLAKRTWSLETVMTELRSNTPLNRARAKFSHWYATIEGAHLQRRVPTPVESRQMEFEAVEEILIAFSEEVDV